MGWMELACPDKQWRHQWRNKGLLERWELDAVSILDTMATSLGIHMPTQGWNLINFGKVCYKDETGWKRTNPENGNRIPITVGVQATEDEDKNLEKHKNICCGFNKDKRSVTSDRYCHYSYCWNHQVMVIIVDLIKYQRMPNTFRNTMFKMGDRFYNWF